MAFSSWRGVVGMINPTMRPGVTEEVIRLLPEGIGLIPLFLNVRRGTEDESETMMPAYEKLVAVLAEQGRHRRSFRQGTGARQPAGLRPYQALLPQSQGCRRDLHAGLGLAHARHHRNLGAGPRRAGHPSGHRTGVGDPEAAACAPAAR